MTTFTERRRGPVQDVRRTRVRGSAKRLFELPGQTLEDSILGVWEDLVSAGRAGCPVCGGNLRAGTGCESCGSELS